MANAENAYEKKVLRDVVEQFDNPTETLRKQSAMRRLIMGLGTVGLFLGFFVGINELLHPFVVGIICAVSGVSVGFGVFLQFAQKQWPVTKRHVNLQSVRERLRELEN